jgi:hypothetical protein
MTMTSSSFRRAFRRATALIGVTLLGIVLAACGSSTKSATTTSTPPSGTTATTSAGTPSASSSLAKIEALSASVQGAEKATFKAVYNVVPTTGASETVTIEQAPPKTVLALSNERVIDTGTATYFCSSSNQCFSEGSTNPLASLTALFSPQTALTEFRAVQASAAAHAAGYNVAISSGSYGGQSTTCANITGTGSPVKYCVTKQGLLAYASSSGGTFSLSSYSGSPPASDFSLPAGATVITIPSGTPS